MEWFAVGVEIVLFTLLNLEVVSAATYAFQIPSLVSSSVLLQDLFSTYGFALSPLGLLELAWFCVAIVSFSRLVIRTVRKA
jgi:hypothetical protein